MGIQMAKDSVGEEIAIGDIVKFRGGYYTIKDFQPGKGRGRTCGIEFEEKVHTLELPDEWNVDKIF